MGKQSTNNNRTETLQKLGEIVLEFLGLGVWGRVIQRAQHLWQDVRLGQKGLYRVLEYEATLELLDGAGTSALVQKKQDVYYLQDGIDSFQDWAWGDGEILLDYQCALSMKQYTDEDIAYYEEGNKTRMLIALREPKSRGDMDRFYIQWKLKDSFTHPFEFFEVAINHPTDNLQINVIFPESCPPNHAWLQQKHSKKTQPLNYQNKHRLADGRWLVTWQLAKPKLHEQYTIHWIWKPTQKKR